MKILKTEKLSQVRNEKDETKGLQLFYHGVTRATIELNEKIFDIDFVFYGYFVPMKVKTVGDHLISPITENQGIINVNSDSHEDSCELFFDIANREFKIISKSDVSKMIKEMIMVTV